MKALLPALVAIFAGSTFSAVSEPARSLYFGRSEQAPRIAGTAVALACASCHGRDGKGETEGGSSAPRLTGDALAGYDPALFRKALTDNAGADGRRLGPSMPRFDLAEDTAAELLAYLRHAEIDETIGVDVDRIRFGVPPDAVDGLETSLEACWSRIGAPAPYGRRVTFSRMDREDVDQVFAVVTAGNFLPENLSSGTARRGTPIISLSETPPRLSPEDVLDLGTRTTGLEDRLRLLSQAGAYVIDEQNIASAPPGARDKTAVLIDPEIAKRFVSVNRHWLPGAIVLGPAEVIDPVAADVAAAGGRAFIARLSRQASDLSSLACEAVHSIERGLIDAGRSVTQTSFLKAARRARNPAAARVGAAGIEFTEAPP